MTLVGFAGLISALHRDGQRTPLLAFRLRQIPEMALASALIALLTIPLADLLGSAPAAVRIASGLGLAFTAAHMGALLARSRAQHIPLGRPNWIAAGLIDVAVVGVAIVGLVTGTGTAYEWLLLALISRAAIAFVIALTDVMAG